MRKREAQVTRSCYDLYHFYAFNLAPLLLHLHLSSFNFPTSIFHLYFCTFTLNVTDTFTVTPRLGITCGWNAKVKLSIPVKEVGGGHAPTSKPSSLYTSTSASLLFHLQFEHCQHRHSHDKHTASDHVAITRLAASPGVDGVQSCTLRSPKWLPHSTQRSRTSASRWWR